MTKLRINSRTGVFGLFVIGAMLAFGYVGCAETPESDPSPTVLDEEELEVGEPVTMSCLVATQLPDPGNANLDCPAPPNTFDVSSFFASNAADTTRAKAGPTWDAWAWATFAALNWPAKIDANQPSGFVRGVPDLSTSFRNAQHTDVAVWETFKEKREVFNETITTSSAWQAITFDPAQQPQNGGSTGIPACSGQTEVSANDARLLSAGSKLSPSISGTQTTDETIEVASPAQETAAALCAGYTDTTNPTSSFCTDTLFADNLFTPTTNGRTPVGPRIWKGNPNDTTARPIYFEVKVNYDFWNYIVPKGFYDDATAFSAAQGASKTDHPKLPFRTSAAAGSGNSPNATFSYQADTVATRYANLSDPNSLPPVGSIHIKAAWLLLDPSVEDTSQYHTTSAIYYRTPENPTSPADTLCYQVDRFGLIGFHIIQRVHALSTTQQPDANFPVGGAFIFATWEHESLGDFNQPSEYYYANFLAKDTLSNTGQAAPFEIEQAAFPNVSAGASGINVVRMENYPLVSTQGVTSAVHDALGSSSVWQNYRLIGTQFLPVNSEEVSMTYNQPYYLANLVVETNTGLQHFQGLPPGVKPSLYYTVTKNVTIPTSMTLFESTYANVIFNRQTAGRGLTNMGGCMGCHGVAQLQGYNFSFVFLAGQRGSGLDTQIHFEVAGGGGISPDN